MEWLIGADGKYVPLNALQAQLIELRATLEDVAAAYDGIRAAIAESHSLVADSRRFRRMRQSGLRLVSPRN